MSDRVTVFSAGASSSFIGQIPLLDSTLIFASGAYCHFMTTLESQRQPAVLQRLHQRRHYMPL